MNSLCKMGIDIGSTTVKVAVMDERDTLLFSDYKRHFANIKETLLDLVKEAYEVTGDVTIAPIITGSGGLSLAKSLGIPFVQEVVAVASALNHFAPQTDVAIELGGEDAKIIYFENGNVEERMNGICAGGTGSFIDQMASLLQTDATGMNEYAKNYKAVYPIAARCGVFAKTDIQPLINEGASKEDLSVSVFQAVVNQTISGLACGKPIRGHVAFLGGPLHFLDQLRACFIRTLKLDDEHTIIPENSHLFAAMGSALNYDENTTLSMAELKKRLSGDLKVEFEVDRMEPLFKDQAEYDAFTERHARAHVETGKLEESRGNLFLGIDAGSTTTKLALVDENGKLVYSFYDNNQGSPLLTSIRAMKEIKEKLPANAHIVHSCSTGYGEALLKSAFKLDDGEVETIAHYYAAAFFDPKVDCILDIGGQDMKCIKIKDGTVDSVQLNEACSSGCGSFIETFAKSLNYSVKDFAKEALFAEHPIDLGTRCTVFMNSKVKQAQKEGASVADISAGLAYSVIKNALFKVIKLADARDLGENVVVQGGTFYNNAVLRAFEKISGVQAIRPDIAGIMGAFGAALIARERFEETGSTTMLPIEDILNLTFTSSLDRCPHCNNHCLLTINHFSDGREFITGNRCERGLGLPKKKDDVPNLYDYKWKRLFSYYKPLTDEEAVRGTVGLPRVLNMYENYPFWHTFFTKLGFSVILSDKTTKRTYEAGIESMPSESVCYPAKLSHGHIMNLLAKDPDFIWMPCVRWERQEDDTATNHYNCPIVMSYPQSLELNVDELSDPKVEYLDPFIPYDNKRELKKRLYEVVAVQRAEDAKVGKGRFKGEPITRREIDEAVNAAWEADIAFKDAMHRKGDETLKWIEDNDAHGIVLAGRPYHNDGEVNHAIPEMLHGFGFAVLTEDSVAHKMQPERPIRVVDQWMYHSRLYRAARFVSTRNDLDLIQLQSFGCGLDALTTDEVQEILEASGKIYTVLKIDEVSNLGAARIRVRSLMAALKEERAQLERKTAAGTVNEVVPIGVHMADGSLEHARQTDLSRRTPVYREAQSAAFEKHNYTKEMQAKGYTILAPQMSPIHFEIFEAILRAEGYNVVLLPSVDHGAVDTGLKYVNNDICYPSILVVGQLMEAVLSGKYDLSRTAVLITQTGGGCRATNYISLIRKALKESGHPTIPVISISAASGLGESSPGFNIFTPDILMKAVYGTLYGDLLMQLLYRTRPYETVPGSADKLYDEFMSRAKTLIPRTDKKSFYRLCQDTIDRFDNLPLTNDRSKPRVGVVGEILVKYHPTANNQVVRVIEQEGCEADVPGLLDFFLFGMSNAINTHDELGTKATSRLTHMAGIKLVDGIRKPLNKMLQKSNRFEPYEEIFELAQKAKTILSLCNTMGEGWLLTAEMVDLIQHGTPNIVCCSPFACLPNHVVGKSVIKRLRQLHPESNIVAVDYDPGASEVNQLNRIKLMISVAKENFKNGGTFKVENPDDPTERVLPGTMSSLRHRGELQDSLVNEGADPGAAYAAYGAIPTAADGTMGDGGKTYGRGEGRIHLSPDQLARIDEAKHKAGVK